MECAEACDHHGGVDLTDVAGVVLERNGPRLATGPIVRSEELVQ